MEKILKAPINGLVKYVFILLNFDIRGGENERRTATYYLPPEFKVSDSNVKEWNKKLNSKAYLYPYQESGTTHRAIEKFASEYPVQFVPFEGVSNELNTKIKQYFFLGANVPEGYSKDVYEFEKQYIYSSLDTKWVSFPIVSRGLCFALLLLEVEARQNLQHLLEHLNRESFMLPDRLLLDLSSNNYPHPFNDLQDLDDVVLISALIASTKGLHFTSVERDSLVRFQKSKVEQEPLELVPFPLLPPYHQRKIEFRVDKNDKKAIEVLIGLHKPRILAFCQRQQSRMDAARAALMSRNLSHNMGSHALANPKLYDALGMDKDAAGARTQLSIFHQYIQNRLDFIARAMNPIPEQPEPLFFINDVMNGLFRQAILLETLLEDRGFHAKGKKPIRFLVRTKTKAGINSDWGIYSLPRSTNERGSAEELPRFRVETGSEPTDVLVGIMGGMIGCQALYSFIENVMRNAAKYGTHCNGENQHGLDLYLDLRDAKQCETEHHENYFVLEVWENLSSAGKVAETIRQHLNDDLLDKEGKTVSKGQGIQEMKIAAEFLSGDHVFKADESCDCRMAEMPSCNVDSYCNYICLENRGVEEKIASASQPLRGYVTAKVFGKQQQDSIVYQLLIPKAGLAGVVSQNESRYEGTDSIFRYGSVSKLAKVGAAFGIVLDDDRDSIDDHVETIRKFQNALPYRLVVLTKSIERTLLWKRNATIRRMLDGYTSAFNSERDIPFRRVHFIESQSLHEIFSATEAPGNELKFKGAEGWDAALLMLYRDWLTAFKGTPDGNVWKVIIGFERKREQVAKHWLAPTMKFNDNHIPLAESEIGVEVQVGGKFSIAENQWDSWSLDSDGMPQCEATIQEGLFSKLQAIVVFDNHGKAVSGVTDEALEKGFRCIHEFSGSGSVSLFQALETPPQEPFTFAWFIYSLLESALLNVAVIDERVAGAALDPETLRLLTRARVFPVFSFRSENAEKREWLYPESVTSLYKDQEDFAANRLREMEDEGVHAAESPQKIKLAWQTRGAERATTTPARSQTPENPLGELDAIIIHEGVVDMVFKDSNYWNESNPEHGFFSIAPRIIRTSGRGAQARHLSEGLPFMEFSELSETTYRALNKYSLGKAVLGVVGPETESEGDI